MKVFVFHDLSTNQAIAFLPDNGTGTEYHAEGNWKIVFYKQNTTTHLYLSPYGIFCLTLLDFSLETLPSWGIA